MRIVVNEAPLFFEVVGTKLAFSGRHTIEVPTLLVLHGGPGFDHTGLRPYFDRFASSMQVIYVDHRGNGRSGGDDPATWNLAQWAADVKSFCDVLSIERPIVLGHSFGGMVAQAYATTYPGHARGLVLSSTAPRFGYSGRLAAFERAGGASARRIAERFFTVGDKAAAEEYARTVIPLYVSNRGAIDADAAARTIRRIDVANHFFRVPDGEIHRMDFRCALASICVPTLVISGGDGDLMTPPSDSEDIASAIPRGQGQLKVFHSARHGVFRDLPDDVERLIRNFVGELPVDP